VGLVHRLVHRVDQLHERAVDVGYGRRRPLQYRVAKKSDGVSCHSVTVVKTGTAPGSGSHPRRIHNDANATGGPARGVRKFERVRERVGIGRDDERAPVGRSEHLH